MLKKILALTILSLHLFASNFSSDFLEEVRKMAPDEETYPLLEELESKGLVLLSDKDAAVRPLFVGAQGNFEKAMASLFATGEIFDLIGVIHTPTPATPLCTEGEISRDLVDPSLETDPKRLFTVKSRAEIMREYLYHGAILYAAFPEKGIERRTDEQVAIYEKLLAQYSENLFEERLSCEVLPSNLIGATYLFRANDHSIYVFSIMASQANAPSDSTTWGLWFGKLTDPLITTRVSQVFHFVRENGGPDLLQMFLDF